MANDYNLACMPQEIIANILRELFKDTIVRKIKFTEYRCLKSHLKKRSWVPIMLVNKSISRIARDVFSQEALVFMYAKQLVSSTPRSGAVGVEKRCGEKELQYFRRAVGNAHFVSHLLKYTSPESVKRRSKHGYTMFENLETIYLQFDKIYLLSWSANFSLQNLGHLLEQSARRGINLHTCLFIEKRASSISQGWMLLLISNSGKAELIEAATMRKEIAERICTMIKDELNCDLKISYEYSTLDSEDEQYEVLKAGRRMQWPKWSGF